MVIDIKYGHTRITGSILLIELINLDDLLYFYFVMKFKSKIKSSMV
jgi:hypothetical protein